MKEPIRSNVGLEAGIKPLLAALKIQKLSDACGILFVSGDALSLSTPLEQIGIVTLLGLREGNIEGADLIMSESQLQLMSIGKQIVPRMIHNFGDSVVSASVEIASIQNEEERQSVMMAKIMDKARSESTKQLFKQITPYIGGAIKPVSELIVSVLYKFLYDKHRDQRQAIPRFEDVVASMGRLGLTSPFLSLALCPSCNNYELVFSRLARFSPNCPKCGFVWPALVVNELTPDFALLKRKNADLPVFISAYLKSKSPFPVQVFPNAEFNLETGKVEVDVFVPDTATGIECKCYANCFAVTDSTISSEVGKTRKQIESYLKLGLARIAVITNYAEPDANKLRIALKDQLDELKGVKELLVLGSDLNAFARFLDQECNKIEQATNTRLQQEFDHRIASQLTEKEGHRKRLRPAKTKRDSLDKPRAT